MGIDRQIINKAVFLDRDGVINRAIVVDGKPYPPSSLKELVILSGVAEGIARLREVGYKIFVVTNQPDVARGTASMDTVQRMNSYLAGQLHIDKVYCCFHDGKENCACRKPKPGMILQAAEEWSVDLSQSFLIGDRWRDIEAANNARVTSVLIDYNYDEKKIDAHFTCTDFTTATDFILNFKTPNHV